MRVFLDIDPGFPPDVARARSRRRLRRATTASSRSASGVGLAGLRGPHVRARLDHDPAAGRAGALAAFAPAADGERSRPSRAGAAPFAPGRVRGQALRPAGARVPDASRSCPALTGQRVRAGARHRRGRGGGPRAARRGTAGSSSTRSWLRPILAAYRRLHRRVARRS